MNKSVGSFNINNSGIINNGMMMAGIYRAKIIKESANEHNVRVYIPSINNVNPLNSDGTLNEEIYNKYKDSFPLASFCAYNKESTTQFDDSYPAWVMFENGDINYPVLMSYTVVSGGSGTSTGSFTTANTGNPNADAIYNALRQAGVSLAGAVAILGNIKNECNFDPNCIGDNGTSYGICQWHNERWENLKKYASENNGDPSSIEIQVGFLVKELQNGYKDLWDALCNAEDNEQSAMELAKKFCSEFERPADIPGQSEQRANNAKEFYPLYKQFGSMSGGGSIGGGDWIYPLTSPHTCDPTTGARYFGAPRNGGSRAHAGMDLIQSPGVGVRACTSGTVMEYNAGYYGNSDALVIKNDDGTWLNYAEIRSSLRPGTHVNKGQIIAQIVTGTSSSMLHIEVYQGDNTEPVVGTNAGQGNYKYVPQKNYSRRADLCDPMFIRNLPQVN